MSMPTRVPGDPPSSHWAIQNLIVTYAELVDDGDFAGLGALLAGATFTGTGAPVSGPEAIEKMFRDMLIVYDDGTPRSTRKQVRRSRAHTSPCCRRYPAWPCRPSSAAGIATASNAATGGGVSRSGASGSISPAT
jgi:hypothetical protein